jgi:DNA segregation ATPase FtsK/SpoIIIE-like protein
MKATAKIFILFLAINSVILIVPQKASAQVSINFQLFYDDLSPYGNWIDSPDYGYAWVPSTSSAFIPYRTNGYWIFTNVGWTWVSNYSWGWAPFHYGRWNYDPYYGWMWVPGYEWGPGWVIWRQSEGYYGWAPIGPGISITFAYGSGYHLPYNYWTCVRDRDFGRTNIYNYYVPTSNNLTIIKNSTVINNIQSDNSTRVRYNAGPDRTEVQRKTGATISPVILREKNRPGQNLNNRELELYRPRVEKSRTNGREPSPSKVVHLKDLKPTTQRNNSTQTQREKQSAGQRNDQQAKEQQVRQQRNDQQAKEQQARQQRNDQQAKEQQARQQHNDQQAKEQQVRQQRNDQQAKEQQVRQQRNDQQAKEQQARQQRNDQQAKEQQARQQRNDQQAKEQQAKEQQARQQRNAREQQIQQQSNQQPKQQHNEPQTKQQQKQKKNY